jgi:hypothetical protein
MSNLYKGPHKDASYHVSVRKLVGSILERPFIKIAHLVPIRLQTWLPKAILVSDWLISRKYSPLKLLCQMN